MPNTTINHLKPEEIIRFSDGTINSESSNKELHPLIVFEGIDGSGKTSLSQMISKEYHYRWSCEPYNNNYRELISKSLVAEERALLFAADRALHCKVLNYDLGFLPCVVDRYIYSNIAYQSVLDKLPQPYLWAIQPLNVIKPSLIILLTCNPHVSVARCKKRNEYWTKTNLENIQNAYIKIIESTHIPTIILNTDKPKNSVLEECKKKMSSFFNMNNYL